MPPIDPARTAATYALVALEDSAVMLDDRLSALDASLSRDKDRRFARQLVFGVLRWQGRIDWIANQLSNRPLAACAPALRQILRLGVFQLLWLDRVPSPAAVHTSVELAKRLVNPGAAKLVNAVLRRLLRQQGRIAYPDGNSVDFLAVYYSHPAWLVGRWLQRWGRPATLRLLKANNAQAPLFVRHTTCRPLPGRARPVGPLPDYYRIDDPGALFSAPFKTSGAFQVQDIQAGLAAALLAPGPGATILDACAAPGGKTVQLRLAMAGTGLLVAADRSPKRLRRVRENARRLGLAGIHAVAADACQGIAGRFDCILVDAPCSGTGTLGRRPDARWRKSPDQLPKLAQTQYRLLSNAFALLRTGGTLVYSTCSLEQEENHILVERFIQATPTARLEKASAFFPDRAWAGRYIQTLPGREPGDGSFAARIGKQVR